MAHYVHARVIATALLAWIANDRPSSAAETAWTKIDAVQGFGGWRAELQRRADQEGRAAGNHFCVVAETFQPPQGLDDAKPPPRETIARVYWREGRRLITWDPGDSSVDATSARAGNDLDLTKDVRATQAEVGSSTYLVTRHWVQNIVHHCERQGSQVLVFKGGHDAGRTARP